MPACGIHSAFTPPDAAPPSPDTFQTVRFSCSSREYKYFIVQDGSLDLPAMRQAAQHLLGEHDFRHFCKADVLQVTGGWRGGEWLSYRLSYRMLWRGCLGEDEGILG